MTSAVAIPARVSLRGNFAWTSLGFAVYAACQWAVVALLAKLGSPEIVGQYALGLAVTAPVLMLAQLNLRSVLATDVRHEYEFRDYRNLRFASLLLALGVIVPLAFWQGGHSGERTLIIFLVALVQAQEGMTDVYHGLVQQHERMDRTAVSLIARGVCGLAALAAGMYYGGSLAAGLFWMLAVRMLVFFGYDSSAAVRGFVAPSPRRPWREQARRQRALLRQALPLGLVLMLGALVTNSPRYFIAHHLGERELGIFSAIFSLAAVGNLMVNSLGQAATPRLARFHAAGDRLGFASLSWRMAGLGAALGAMGMLCAVLVGPLVLTLAYRPEYAQRNGLLVAAMAASGMVFVASLLGYAITAARRFREQMPLQLACLIVTALAAWVLIPRLGLTGAAAAIGLGALVQAALEAWILWRVA